MRAETVSVLFIAVFPGLAQSMSLSKSQINIFLINKGINECFIPAFPSDLGLKQAWCLALCCPDKPYLMVATPEDQVYGAGFVPLCTTDNSPDPRLNKVIFYHITEIIPFNNQFVGGA